MKKSTGKLSTKEFEEVKVIPNMSTSELEGRIIAEHTEKIQLGELSDRDTASIIVDLMGVLKEGKIEGETNSTYEERIRSNAKEILEIDNNR